MFPLFLKIYFNFANNNNNLKLSFFVYIFVKQEGELYYSIVVGSTHGKKINGLHGFLLQLLRQQRL